MRGYYDPVGWAAPPCGTPERPRTQHPRLVPTEPMRTNSTLILLIMTALLLASGCVYQAALSQGNLLDQEDIDQLEVGMTPGQVRFLLGTPMIDDPFHENRWDYIYYLQIGRDKAILKRWVSVIFDNENVSEIIRDQELRPDL